MQRTYATHRTLRFLFDLLAVPRDNSNSTTNKNLSLKAHGYIARRIYSYPLGFRSTDALPESPFSFFLISSFLSPSVLSPARPPPPPPLSVQKAPFYTFLLFFLPFSLARSQHEPVHFRSPSGKDLVSCSSLRLQLIQRNFTFFGLGV